MGENVTRIVAIGMAALSAQSAGAGEFEAFGVGCPNRSGESPELVVDGHAIAGGSIVLDFDGDATRSQAFVFAGIGGMTSSFGQCALEILAPVPFPLGPFQLDVLGDFALATSVPAVLPTPFEFTIQVIEIDPQAPNGQFGMSNGVRCDLDDAPVYPVPAWRLGNNPVDLAVGDLNGDSYLDVVGIDAVSPFASCYFGDGRGGFDAAPPIFAASAPGDSIELADLDSDGVIDMALASSSSVIIGYGNGNGTFGPMHYHGAGFYASAPRVGDLDHDGDLDIVVVNGPPKMIHVLRATSTGVFPAYGEMYIVGSSPRRCAIGDLDENGVADIAVANSVGGTVSVLFSQAGGTFSAASSHSIPMQAWTIDIGNTDASGGPDLIVGSAGGHAIAVLPGDGLGGFGPAKISAACYGAYSFAAFADDTDPFTDMVVGTGAGSTLCIMRGNGQGQFVSTETADIGLGADIVLPADVDGDGVDEFVVLSAHRAFGIVGRQSDATLQAGESHSMFKFFGILATADFDLDGRSDIVAGSSFAPAHGPIAYFRAKSDDAFAAGYLLQTHIAPYDLAAADIDGDGAFDLASAAFYGIEVAFGDGSGPFAPPTWVATQGANYTLALADFDSDGRVDVVTSHSDFPGTSPGSHRLGVRLGVAGALWPTLVEFPMGYESHQLVVGDFDADGALDLVATHDAASIASFYRGDSFGGFLSATTFAAGLGLDAADAADLDRDGALDLAVCRPQHNQISIFRYDGLGAFSLLSSYATSQWPSDLVLCDFDGDSDVDVVSTDGVSSSVAIRRNDGDAVFGSAQLHAAGYFPHQVIAAHFDSDTTIDLAVISSFFKDPSVLRVIRHR